MIPQGTINEILQSKGTAFVSVRPEATVFEAVQLMAEKNVGSVLVTEGDQLVGIITERDYTRKVELKGKSSKQLKARELQTSKVLYVSPNHGVDECLRLMTDHRVRHLPVLAGGKIVGVISIGDLVNWIITTQGTTIQQLETYITGYPG
jgi:CBS domain-containing protein